MSLRFAFLLLVTLTLLAAPCLGQEAAPVGPFTEVETAVCTAIEERQPAGTALSFGSDVGQLFFWTKCIGATDTTAIQHVWVREGETMATVDLPVRSSAWRTWSSKQILPSWTGNWEVRVLDAGGNIIKAVAFKIEAEPAESPAEAVAEPEAEPAEEPVEEPVEEPAEEVETETDSL
ncbi:MAG: DUF2914 domain-containing protein [Candidatus Zixiibacteriota bacterium]|nr:MAG: DUF2914 domain-containing protein [candidate division Zixibacteria bacterium]